jgi:hypothetical protein
VWASCFKNHDYISKKEKKKDLDVFKNQNPVNLLICKCSSLSIEKVQANPSSSRIFLTDAAHAL